jgi:hypothetical protein
MARKRTQPAPEHGATDLVEGEILRNGADGGALPTPHARARRLKTVRDVSMELSTIYGMARRGRMTWQDASRAAFVLRVAGDMLTASDIEARLERIEEEQGDRT